MRILILGGTSFVGRAIVEDALRTGAEVTLFGRGKTGAGLFPGLTRLIGDRDTGDYAALRDGSWDAVVDVSGYVPRHVGQAMDALGDRVERYLFISSHAVYARTGVAPGSTEDTPRRPPVRDTEELYDETYGRLKVACEDDVLARYGARATIVRPGKVAGPYDPSDTFTYWARRAARGGRVALPADPGQPVQIIDSRDLARLVVQLLADDRPGAFHAVGPAEPVTLGGLIETCARVAGSQVEIVRVSAEGAPPMFPLVRPDWPTQQRNPARARAAGLPATPLEVTAADVLAWDRERGEPPLECGYSPEEERALLVREDGAAVDG
ncbi:NAD-dependent epimerase/dehydratase family protein [Streptomyces inhibens]|uniref:NAD-dependent epimerase/dehydratase family protein n=1 Tax=Streptomyces inhibens TaxID=2293571 RepID=A0A371QBR3_STRIH|nr:NAD-dependent epimerase/dehydratase family protein [Streptomyces inhibens]REK92150.1 NAD-dependent epimerase/dehydratase family protein [Streptomyces inhibens]